MTSLLLSVLAAASLAGVADGAAATRSDQALPSHLQAARALPPVSANYRAGNHLADAAPDPALGDATDESACKRRGGHWDDRKLRCRRGGWWMQDGARLVIVAGTVAGAIDAISGDGHPISH